MDNWRKASYSQGASNCVETGSGNGQIGVQDTKNRTVTLTVSASSWKDFLSGLKAA